MATAKLTSPASLSVNHTPQDVPHFVYLDMQDELRMWRMIALLAVSVALHVLFLAGIITLPRLIPRRPAEVVVVNGATPNRDLTFLSLPPDIQRNIVPPQTNIISDKDRMAMSRHPQLTAPPRKILDSAPPGAPGSPGANVRPTPQTSPGAPVTPGSNNQQANQTSTNQNNNQQIAALNPPHVGGTPHVNFGVPMSPGTQIANAANATITHGGGGIGGEYGLDAGGRSKVAGDLDILSDTMGVDFSAYLARMRVDIIRNWRQFMPPSVFPPLSKSGKVVVRFAIMRDGSVRSLEIVGSSGDVALDRPAYSAISSNNPFQPLPQQFGGQYLMIQGRFYYNPTKDDLE